MNHPTSRSDIAGAAPGGPSTASSTMIEACDRLAQKLEEVGGIFREQIQAWQMIREPAAPSPGGREKPAATAVDAQAMERDPLADQAPRRPQPARPEIEPGRGAGVPAQGETGGPSAGATEAEGMGAMTENARRLVDTFSRSREGWQDQAAALQQALAAIMDFLEEQAATAAPKLDVAEIISRLRNLEEEQQSLQSQFNTNRWGPS